MSYTSREKEGLKNGENDREAEKKKMVALEPSRRPGPRGKERNSS